MPTFLDHDNRAPFQSLGAVGEDCGQALNDMGGPHVVEAKEDNPRSVTAGECGDLSEIEIDGENDPSFGDRLVEDIAVRESLKPTFRTFVKPGARIIPPPG